MWRDPGAPADSFYQVRPECTDVPKTRFRIKAGKTLSARKWRAAFTSEGYLDIGKTLRRIYRGGIHPSIRGEVWEFLLGCYDPKSTFEEREHIRQRRRVQYAVLKEECRTMFPMIGSGSFITAPVITENGDPIVDPITLHEAQAAKELSSGGQQNGNPGCEMVKEHDKRIIQWKLSLHQIGLDVVRTDRTLVFYEKQENLAKLWDILSVYAWFDKDINYCQGMSDLCSPMIILINDEADAFWCFERLMRRLVIAFSQQMMWALEYDPDLFLMYEDPDLAAVKSEGSKGRSKSTRQCGKFERENLKNRSKGAEAPLPISVFLVASVLKDKSTKLLTEAKGLDDVVKILNDIAGNLDAKKACSGAMKLHKKYLKKVTKHKSQSRRNASAPMQFISQGARL